MDEPIRKYEVFKGNSVFEEDASYDAFAGLYLPITVCLVKIFINIAITCISSVQNLMRRSR